MGKVKKKADTGIDNARELLDVLSLQGVKTYFVSPGSRNTPLLVGLEAREELVKHVINDERTAAFAALGYSLVSQQPVALVCTSGTAMYNYAPAVAEAYYQHVPLVIITADRPSQWIDQDDSQTLHQYAALSKIVKRSFDIHADAGILSECPGPLFATEREWYVNRIANEAVLTAISGTKGPVHINVQFADKLNTTITYKPCEHRVVENIPSERSLSRESIADIARRLAGKRILVVAGFMAPNHNLNRALSKFAGLPNVAVMCETISNLHLDGTPWMIDSLLTNLDDDSFDMLVPDVVITIGGALVSRMLKSFLRRCNETVHWTLADTDVSVDCMQRLGVHVDIEPYAFFRDLTGPIGKLQDQIGPQIFDPDFDFGSLDTKSLAKKKGKHVIEHNWEELLDNPNSPYFYAVNVESMRSQAKVSNFLKVMETPWSELSALSLVFNEMPENFNLFLSNGTCVRYAQLLTRNMPHACFCNRGVSGIEGGNATAFGGSLAYKGPTLLLTGDMSFAYCPEVMALRRLGGELRIIVVNNSGGGIFRFIRSTRDLDMREKYFCADPQLPVKALAEAYGWTYMSASNDAELKASLKEFWQTPFALLEIKVNPETSAETLIKYLE